MPPSRFGLRVTVRLHDTVVAQHVRWDRLGMAAVVGESAEEAVPTRDDRPLATIRWTGPDRVLVRPVTADGPGGVLEPGGRLCWDNGEGVTVDLDLVRHQPARRFGGSGGGDMALLTMVLTLLVGVGQARVVMGHLFPEAAGAYDISREPRPELIARLLKRQLEGAEEGLEERVERPDHVKAHESFYLPAGNEGDLSQVGGGARVGAEVRRNRPEPEMATDPGATGPAGGQTEAPPPVVEGEADQFLALLTGSEGDLPAPPSLGGVPDPVEHFLGWGFRDWFEVRDARPALERDIARQLDLVRDRLSIDPDDPWALQLLGYYAYLSENHVLGRSTYERYIRLYPDDPAGYNNLALVYKRTHDYAHEEALYRKALDMDPLDRHVLNNLAVNLAHQGRTDEALRVMGFVDELLPDDPYAELHRAKILACMGEREAAYRHLKRALDGAGRLDSLHHVEFRQDLRLDPAFDEMRRERRFERLLRRAYGSDADLLLQGRGTVLHWVGGTDG